MWRPGRRASARPANRWCKSRRSTTWKPTSTSWRSPRRRRLPRRNRPRLAPWLSPGRAPPPPGAQPRPPPAPPPRKPVAEEDDDIVSADDVVEDDEEPVKKAPPRPAK